MPCSISLLVEFILDVSRVIQEPAKSNVIEAVGDYTVQGAGTPPPVDTPPIVDAGADVDVLQGQLVTLDGSAKDMNGEIIRCGWIAPDEIKPLLVQDPDDITKMTFTAPNLNAGEDVRGLVFTFEAEDNTHHISTDQTIVTIRRGIPQPTDCAEHEHKDSNGVCVCDDGFARDTTGKCVPVVTPPSGDIIYDSRRDSSLHDGKVRTVTHEGNLNPGGLGIECRASGNPKINVNADGTFSLVTEPGFGRFYVYAKNYNSTMEITNAIMTGNTDNESLKMRSRHNEPGQSCSGGSPIDGNRFGGYGFAISKNGWDAKRELTHNCHDQSKSGSIPKNIEIGKMFKAIFTVKDEGNSVKQLGSIDYMDGSGPKQVMDKTDTSPETFMVNQDLYNQTSYFWVRNNGNGEIKIERLIIKKA